MTDSSDSNILRRRKMMSESRRNRRKNKKNTHQQKNLITKKDRVIGISAMIGLFIAAVILIIYLNLEFIKYLFYL
jgi:uncharacterized membrane protein|tara:strand:+ start:268 stop:492 length:225 start_codon:yes stop_codon:yes gene_type:complete